MHALKRQEHTAEMEAWLFAVLLLCFCAQVRSEPRCDLTEFLHPNGTCVACPVCEPGEQLSEDCGFGYGDGGVCVGCEEGTFSTETGVAPCRRCTQCHLLNRPVEAECSPTRNQLCGQCLPGFYELRSMTGEVELLCVPCSIHDTVHEECLLFASKSSKTRSVVSEQSIKDSPEKEVKDENLSVVLIGATVASLVFLISLLLWIVLLTAERFKQVPEDSAKPEGLLSAANLQYESQSGHAENTTTRPDIPSETASAEESTRGQSSVSRESELHPPTSIVINVTTNIKPCSQKTDNITQEERQGFTTEEMEHKLQKIWEITQGQSIEMLDYDSVQDLSLLLDSPENTHALRKLGLSLGVPPQVTAHLHSFQDLFQYLRTSTYIQLPQLAQAAALLPSFDIVSRIHKAVVK